jgi:hypothetical protein
MVNAPASSERLADHFVSYLFDQYTGSFHVRRVASWVGFVVKAVEKVSNCSLRLEQKRQIMFDFAGYKFKVKYNHKTGSRGGLDIVEVLPGRGAPEGVALMHITNLADAEDCYLTLRTRLESLVEKREPSLVVFKKIEMTTN